MTYYKLEVGVWQGWEGEADLFVGRLIVWGADALGWGGSMSEMRRGVDIRCGVIWYGPVREMGCGAGWFSPIAQV